jgi:hypothetical protein
MKRLLPLLLAACAHAPVAAPPSTPTPIVQVAVQDDLPMPKDRCWTKAGMMGFWTCYLGTTMCIPQPDIAFYLNRGAILSPCPREME